MDSKTAALNSLYIILFSQAASFINTLVRGTVPEFDWLVLLAMCVGGVLGGIFGRSISAKLTNKGVDRLFPRDYGRYNRDKLLQPGHVLCVIWNTK